MTDGPRWLGYVLGALAFLGFLGWFYEGCSECERRGGVYVHGAVGYVCVGARP